MDRYGFSMGFSMVLICFFNILHKKNIWSATVFFRVTLHPSSPEAPSNDLTNLYVLFVACSNTKQTFWKKKLILCWIEGYWRFKRNKNLGLQHGATSRPWLVRKRAKGCSCISPRGYFWYLVQSVLQQPVGHSYPLVEVLRSWDTTRGSGAQ